MAPWSTAGTEVPMAPRSTAGTRCAVPVAPPPSVPSPSVPANGSASLTTKAGRSRRRSGLATTAWALLLFLLYT